MESETSELTTDQIELCIRLLDDYQEKEDLTQNEWAEVQAAKDRLDEWLVD